MLLIIGVVENAVILSQINLTELQRSIVRNADLPLIMLRLVLDISQC